VRERDYRRKEGGRSGEAGGGREEGRGGGMRERERERG